MTEYTHPVCISILIRLFFYWIIILCIFNGKSIKYYRLKQTVDGTISISVSSRLSNDLRLESSINKFRRYYVADVFCENPSKPESTNRVVVEFFSREMTESSAKKIECYWILLISRERDDDSQVMIITILGFTLAMRWSAKMFRSQAIRTFFHGKWDDVKSTFSTNYPWITIYLYKRLMRYLSITN